MLARKAHLKIFRALKHSRHSGSTRTLGLSDGTRALKPLKDSGT